MFKRIMSLCSKWEQTMSCWRSLRSSRKKPKVA